MIELRAGQLGIHREADQRSRLGCGRGAKYRAEHAARFERVTHRDRPPLFAGLQGQNLRPAGIDVVAQRIESFAQIRSVHMQLGAAPVGIADSAAHGVQSLNLRGQQPRTEDRRIGVIFDVFGLPGRARDDPGPTGEGLGKAGGAKVHAILESQLIDEPRTVRTMRPQRVRLVDDERTAVPVGDIKQVKQRGHAARGGIDRVHHHEARPVPGDQPLERVRTVVAENDFLRAGAAHPFPQGHVGVHVDIHRPPGVDDGLQQPDICLPAGLGQDRGLRPHEAGHRRLEAPLKVVAVKKDGGHHHGSVIHLGRAALGFAHPRVGGHTKVIVAPQHDCRGTRRAANQDVFALRPGDTAIIVVAVNPLAQKVRFRGPDIPSNPQRHDRGHLCLLSRSVCLVHQRLFLLAFFAFSTTRQWSLRRGNAGVMPPRH